MALPESGAMDVETSTAEHEREGDSSTKIERGFNGQEGSAKALLRQPPHLPLASRPLAA